MLLSGRECHKQRARRKAEPFVYGSPDMTRTCDPLVNSQLLYRLSYPGTRGKPGENTARLRGCQFARSSAALPPQKGSAALGE